MLYDISTLGWGHRNNYARTGIYRTVENVARGLKTAPDCELRFSAIGSFRLHAQCVDYLAAEPDLKSVAFKSEGIESTAVRRLHKLAQNMNGGRKRSIPARALRKISEAGIDLIEASRNSVKPRDWRESDVFHSSQFPLPSKSITGHRVKRFLTVYDLIPLIYPQMTGAGFSSLFQKIIDSITPDDWIICISNSVKTDVCNHLNVDPSRVFVAPLAAERNLFYPCTDPEKQASVRQKYLLPEVPYVLALGSLEPRKNLNQTVESFTRLVNQEGIKDLALVVVGEKTWGYEGAMAKLNKFEHLKDRIAFTGYVDDQDLAPLYSGAAAFVYPSLCEGFGLPPLEAMQCGVPVICSNATSLPEVVGDAALLVEPTDTDAWCQSLLSLYSNETLRNELAQKSLRRAETFSWERCTGEVIAAYHAALSQ